MTKQRFAICKNVQLLFSYSVSEQPHGVSGSTVFQENQLPGALRHRHETTSGTRNGRPRVRYRTTDNILHCSFTLAVGGGDLDPSPRVAVCHRRNRIVSLVMRFLFPTAVHQVETTGKLSQVTVPPLAVRDGL